MHPLIADILKHASYRKACYDLAKGDGKDLYQEMLLALLEKGDAKLWDVWNSGGHRWYVLSMIYRLYLGKGSLWDKVYRDKIMIVDVPLDAQLVSIIEYDFNEDAEFERKTELMKEAINELHWYEKQLFFVYAEAKNMRKISASTTIPYNSIRLTIKNVKDKIKERIEK